MEKYNAVLAKAMREENIVSVHYTLSDLDNIYCGVVDSLNESECRMRLFTRHG